MFNNRLALNKTQLGQWLLSGIVQKPVSIPPKWEDSQQLIVC